MVGGLRGGPRKQAGDGVGPEEHLHLVRLLAPGQPIPVVAIGHQVELRVTVARRVGRLGTCRERRHARARI